jgi:hypothetical protein
VMAVAAQRVRKCEVRRRFGAKIPKPSCSSSVSCAPLGMSAGGDRGMWWGSLCDVIAVAGRRVRKREAGRGLGAKILKPTAVARFRAAFGMQVVDWGAVGLYHPYQHYLGGWGHGSGLVYLYGVALLTFCS